MSYFVSVLILFVSFGLQKYDVLKCSRCAGRILSNAKVLLHDKFYGRGSTFWFFYSSGARD